jgi:hypothetical protein
MTITKTSNSGFTGIKYNDIAADNNYMETIASALVGAGGTASITFSNIPQGYKHLQIRGIARTNRPDGNQDGIKLVYNSDTGSNYANHYLLGNGSAASTSGGSSVNYNWFNGVTNSVSTANCYGGFLLDLIDYSNTSKYKTLRFLSGREDNTAGAVWFESGIWTNNAPVTSIRFTPNTGPNFVQHTRLSLYGIKG